MLEIVKFETEQGQLVQFTAQDVKERICPQATDQELALVMALCQQQRLNPFTRDVYVIKYGNAPASIVTGKEVFTKRANANPGYEGFEAGVTFLNARGEVCQREGSAVYKAANETLLGGWCRVFVKGRRPFYDEVDLAEYSTGKSGWAKMPATMVRKVALVHCLREAFPEDFQGLYTPEEMGRTGEQVLEIEKQDPERATVSQTSNTAPVIEAEIVEEPQPNGAHPQQLERIDQLAEQFAEMRGKTAGEVLDALYGSATMKNAGFTTADKLTRGEALAAINLLNSWIARAENDTFMKPEEGEAV